jgi:hypothetical protein
VISFDTTRWREREKVCTLAGPVLCAMSKNGYSRKRSTRDVIGFGGEYDASFKDRCEVATGRAICQGSVGLVEAQKGFSVNWIEWCKRLLGDK